MINFSQVHHFYLNSQMEYQANKFIISLIKDYHFLIIIIIIHNYIFCAFIIHNHFYSIKIIFKMSLYH